ncbi:HCLS1-associated protein X-1-like isoform X2 [Patiria miniata]|uniref:HCLS1-associated protein X-1 n=1 Tax=Patiria miniata TaxID=46514 RepID=A0A914B8F3_PATMI|nr:HCLS1-associated protein X-1-like isoform X2 [Patiria miniata]
MSADQDSATILQDDSDCNSLTIHDSDDHDVFNTPGGFGFFGNHFGQGEQEDMEDDSTFDPGQRGGFHPPSSGDFFFKFEEESQDMFRHFEEMFKNFGLSTFPPSAFSRIDEEASPALPSSRHRTPRDEMLKHPDSGHPSALTAIKPDHLEGEEDNPEDGAQSWHSLWNNKPKWHWPVPTLPSTPSCKKDRDLDDEVKGRKLDEILKEANPPDHPAQSPSSRSYFRSISIQTIRKQDGTVEQRRTETDADGNVTTTVKSSNPEESDLPSLTPDRRRPRWDKNRITDDGAIIGQDKTASIFDKLFGSWGRR